MKMLLLKLDVGKMFVDINHARFANTSRGEIDLKDESLNVRKGTCEDGCWSKIPLGRTIVVGRRIVSIICYQRLC